MNILKANNRINLSKRLEKAAAMVRKDSIVADVGCDHGKLSAYLVLSRICKFVYAIDISRPSLQKATDLFVKLEISEKAKVICQDGLKGLNLEKITDVVIAGLGYDVIKKIMTEATWLKDSNIQLILIPSSRHKQLREYLCVEGYEIQDEVAVVESGHIYSVMKVRYSGKSTEISNIFSEFGKIFDSDGDNKEYILAISKRTMKILEESKKAKSIDRRKVENAKEVLKHIYFLEQGGDLHGKSN